MPEEQMMTENNTPGDVLPDSNAEIEGSVPTTVIPKKSNKKVVIIGTIVGLMVLAVVIGLIVLLVCRGGGDTSRESGETTEINWGELSPDERVATVVAQMKTKIADELESFGSGVNIKEVAGEDIADVVYRAEDMLAFTYLDSSVGLSVSAGTNRSADDYIASDEFFESIVDDLRKAGFEDYYAEFASGWSEESYLNEETGVICMVISVSIPFSFTCGHTSWLDDERKALVNELAEAMMAKDALTERTLLKVSASQIRDSDYEPYQTVNAGLFEYGYGSGASGFFYRVSPEAEWQYLGVAQAPLDCATFDTEDVRRAYAGYMWCYNETGEVQLVELVM